MSKVIITCGKICSGKSFYSNRIKDELNAVIISPDEATYDLINNEQGEFYNVFSERLNKYLTKKVGEIVKAGANVIFERGLWSHKDRIEIKEYYKNMGIDCEIHYVCVDDRTWKQNIAKRNQRVLDGVETTVPTTVEETTEEITEVREHWDGPVLNPNAGTVEGPSGKETYYNLDMSGVVSIMKSCGYDYEYWERDDGVKMYGDYVMCAANLDVHPRGSLVESSLGTAIVCDTGGFAESNPNQLDIATNW